MRRGHKLRFAAEKCLVALYLSYFSYCCHDYFFRDRYCTNEILRCEVVDNWSNREWVFCVGKLS